jgi:hypothetical protein
VNDPESGHLAGGWLLVAPVDAPAVARALRLARRVGERDGIAPPTSLLTLMAAVEAAERAALTAANGSAAVPREPDLPQSPPDGLSTLEAAVAIGCKPRNVRDLARRAVLSARRHGRAWVLDPGEVAAYARRRRAAS